MDENMHENSEEVMVSIVIPVYNQEKYISNCLNSLLKQTYRKIEIIVIDDGSTDRSFDIISSFAFRDKRIKLIHIDNAGVSNARNIGIQNASGKYISFVDADDEVCEYYIEYLLYALEITGLRMAMCNYEQVGEKHSTSWNVENMSVRQMDVFSDYDYSTSFQLRHVWGTIFLLEDVIQFRFDTSLSVGEDALFVAHLVSLNKRFAVVDQILYKYILHNNTLSHGEFNDKKATCYVAWQEIVKLYQTACPRLLPGCYISMATEIISATNNILYDGMTPRKEYNKKLFCMSMGYARRILIPILQSNWYYKNKILYVLFCISPKIHHALLSRRTCNKQNKSGNQNDT